MQQPVAAIAHCTQMGIYRLGDLMNFASELQNRELKDIFIICCDGLTGFASPRSNRFAPASLHLVFEFEDRLPSDQFHA